MTQNTSYAHLTPLQAHDVALATLNNTLLDADEEAFFALSRRQEKLHYEQEHAACRLRETTVHITFIPKFRTDRKRRKGFTAAVLKEATMERAMEVFAGWAGKRVERLRFVVRGRKVDVGDVVGEVSFGCCVVVLGVC